MHERRVIQPPDPSPGEIRQRGDSWWSHPSIILEASRSLPGQAPLAASYRAATRSQFTTFQNADK